MFGVFGVTGLIKSLAVNQSDLRVTASRKFGNVKATAVKRDSEETDAVTSYRWGIYAKCN